MLWIRQAQKRSGHGASQYEPAPVPSPRVGSDTLLRLAIVGLVFVIMMILIIDLRICARPVER